jgi:hypothetical protein
MMQRFHLLAVGLLLLGPCLSAAATGSVTPPGGAPPGDDSLQVVLHSGPYRMVELQGGVRIRMEGFDHLKQPGRPMLPEAESLILLPPGARVRYLETEPLGDWRLEGEFEVEPTPTFPVMSPLPGSSELHEKQAADWAARQHKGPF